MVCKLCPARKNCFDKGSCGNCAFGQAFEGLYKKAERLKAKNKKLEAENKALKERLENLLCPDFGKENDVARCDNCQANKVCDHNRFGFENCGNYISSDVVPKSEVVREIFKDIFAVFRGYEFDALMSNRSCCVFHFRDFMSDILKIKDKYTEGKT